MPKILIVDDDVIITNLMQLLVSMEGHQPTIVNDSLKAVETAHAVNPDLITLDLMMPHLTGFELCALLREDPKFAQTPIVIVSAKDDAESKDRSRQVGANDYITKPFHPDELIGKIKSLTT